MVPKIDTRFHDYVKIGHMHWIAVNNHAREFLGILLDLCIRHLKQKSTMFAQVGVPSYTINASCSCMISYKLCALWQQRTR